MKKALMIAASVILATPAMAAEPNAAFEGFIDTTARSWFEVPEVREAMKASNAAHTGMDEDALVRLDNAWRDEVGASEGPTIQPIVSNSISEALRRHVETSGGLVTEIILMDNRGMNVAVSSVTSDFWQGDEAKFLETYPHGPAAVHVGEIEFDESSQSYQVQVSFTIVDSEGAPLGAATVALNAEMF